MLSGIYVWFILSWLQLTSTQNALRLGLAWLVLTVVFEFLFGRCMMGNPGASLVHEYKLLARRVWVLVLLWIAAAPSIFHRLQRRRKASAAWWFARTGPATHAGQMPERLVSSLFPV